MSASKDAPVSLVLLPISGAHVAVEAKSVTRITRDEAWTDDLAVLLDVPPPAEERLIVELEGGVRLLAGTRVQRKDVPLGRFQRVPPILGGLINAVGLRALFCEDGQVWLVLAVDMRAQSKQIEPSCSSPPQP